MSGGVLEQLLTELPVKCTPSRIPEVVEIDVTELDLQEAIRVSAIDLGEGVTIRAERSRTICMVAVPKLTVEEVEPEEGELELGTVGEGGEGDPLGEGGL